MEYLLLIAPSLVVMIVLFVLLKLLQKRNVTIPAVKGGLPFFGQMFVMLKGSPWDSMAKWVENYGKIFRIHLFGSDAIVVADPKLLKIILATKLSVFKKDLVWTYKPFLVLLGNGLVTSDGLSWRHQRTLLANHLKINVLEDIPDMALRAVQRLRVKLEKAKVDGSVIEMAEEFRHLTLQVIAETILSISPEESDETFAHMYLPIVEEGNLRTWNPERMYLPTPSWFKFRRDVAKLNNYVTEIITKRWKLRQQEAEALAADPTVVNSRRQDTLDKCLSAVSPEDWGPAAITQLRDEIKTFILAGHETSASMLTWSLYELSREDSPENRKSLQTVRDEARGVYESCSKDGEGEINKLPPRNVLDRLVFSECCLRESLRKYSVVPTVVRVNSEQETQLGEHPICKGSTLMLCLQGVHHSPEFWPEPLKYRPERFLEPIAPYTFLPFVEGPRMCLGQYLSLLESKVVLSLLLSEYRFEITNPEDAGLKHPFMVPIIPKTGHFMKIHSVTK